MLHVRQFCLPGAAPSGKHAHSVTSAGTTRSRVNFFMNKFRQLGFVEYNGDMKVHSSLLNVVLRD
jgi:hypothetical protein